MSVDRAYPKSDDAVVLSAEVIVKIVTANRRTMCASHAARVRRHTTLARALCVVIPALLRCRQRRRSFSDCHYGRYANRKSLPVTPITTRSSAMVSRHGAAHTAAMVGRDGWPRRSRPHHRRASRCPDPVFRPARGTCSVTRQRFGSRAAGNQPCSVTRQPFGSRAAGNQPCSVTRQRFGSRAARNQPCSVTRQRFGSRAAGNQPCSVTRQRFGSRAARNQPLVARRRTCATLTGLWPAISRTQADNDACPASITLNQMSITLNQMSITLNQMSITLNQTALSPLET